MNKKFKRLLLGILGTTLIIVGYINLFVAEPPANLSNKNITAIKNNNEIITGILVVSSENILVLYSGGKLIEVQKSDLIKIEGLATEQYIRNRVLKWVIVTIAGGIMIWAAIFLL
ncbi:MAG: hypothetical protein RBT37_07560 [Dissulfurispiraceae bacterium]|jgi:hypothetical protein|nr:hypothetical protein [Dissulfurispiraceae bacterium]